MLRCPWWVLWPVVLVVVACSRAGSGRELDPARCETRFDVQRNKIIRTEESREMGARYLAELDVGSRAECRRLCCETDACDVFVLEEKSPGSCYLFACGPPEDFRCKFTHHGNFSSGVMALSRHLAELQDMEPAPTDPPTTTTTAATTTPSTTTSRPPPPPRMPAVAPTAVPRCSRYQFACHSGGECIAVYNACDGVPQCADGSDEAPELGCPSAQPPARVAQPAQHWPHRLAMAQPDESRQNDDGPTRIFSHTGGLMQTGPDDVTRRHPHIQPPPPPPPAAPAHLPQPYSYGEEVSEGVGPGGGPGDGGWGGAWRWGPRWGLPPPPPRGDEAPPPPPNMPELPPHDAPKKGPRPSRPAAAAAVSPAVVAATTPAPAPRVMATTTRTTPTPAPAPTSPAATLRTRDTIHDKLLAETAASGQHEEEGAAATPASAALLLVLGVCVSVAACAVASRGMRRRRRRGGGARSAHDADYLVNGMYL